MERTTDGFELAEVDLELRGEGTILGARQKGRSDLKLAKLISDQPLVADARTMAEELVAQDPDLAGHGLLVDELRSSSTKTRPSSCSRADRPVAAQHRRGTGHRPPGIRCLPVVWSGACDRWGAPGPASVGAGRHRRCGRPRTGCGRRCSTSCSASGGVDGLQVADLFAGSGALGIEALSRGAASVTFVDHSPEALAAVRANLASVGLGDAERDG